MHTSSVSESLLFHPHLNPNLNQKLMSTAPILSYPSPSSPQLASFARRMDPNPPPSIPHTKQYVFVDEYNRHKRLKVMRACDGCRKRKIRCDGALQNGPWPCGACVRLKLKCIPPTLDADDDLPTPDGAVGQHQFSFQNTTVQNGAKVTDTPRRPQLMSEWQTPVAPPVADPVTTPLQGNLDAGIYTTQYFNPHIGTRLDPVQPIFATDSYSSSNTTPSRYQHDGPPPLLRSPTGASSSTGDPQDVDATVRELSEHMGDLTIDITSTAPFITNEKKFLAETPAEEEPDVVLPASVSTDSTVRIPPEMMPSDERVIDYLGYFFDYIHPYVPVLNKAAFYEQWRSARHSISPLLLEGIFACVSRYIEQPHDVRLWLALASKHEENFKDVPRLSTIQAMILLTKAREVIPKRGYYYRSWMAVKYMTTMAIDLGLHEHYDQHKQNGSCKLSKADCMLRSRIWQNIFILEVLIGAPLGRSDFAVEPEAVDFTIQAPSPDGDSFEYATSRRYTYMAQTFQNIKESNRMWHRMKRVKKEWALDPAFVERNEALQKWHTQLPSDMRIHFPEDGSPPWLRGDHFVAYVHIYHHLTVVMHHRPQLQALLDKGDQRFKEHLDLCLQAASYMCRIQEALIRDFGLHGLQWMQRGVNFTIYSVLTCTMLHLAAITSPDPTQNSHARTFFERHMRVLEACQPGANPAMQAQINALREAFSQDTSRAFELKVTLGLRSPSADSNPSPSDLQDSPQSAPITISNWSRNEDTKPVSPSTEYGPSSYDTMSQQGLSTPTPMGYHSASFQAPTATTFATQNLMRASATSSQNGYALEPIVSNEQLRQPPVWDPSTIFNQWHTAFGGQSQAPPQQPHTTETRMGSNPATHMMPGQISPTAHTSALYSPQSISNPGALVPEPIVDVPTVTPVMWQDAFTNAYVSGHGQKRYREMSADHTAYGNSYSKRRG